MNEPNEPKGALTDEEISRLIESGRTIPLSENYRASDEQLAFICDVVTRVQDRNGLGHVGQLTPENIRPKKGSGRKLARQLWAKIRPTESFDAEIDKGTILMLVRQFFMHERFEVLCNVIIERLGEWDGE